MNRFGGDTIFLPSKLLSKKSIDIFNMGLVNYIVAHQLPKKKYCDSIFKKKTKKLSVHHIEKSPHYNLDEMKTSICYKSMLTATLCTIVKRW